MSTLPQTTLAFDDVGAGEPAVLCLPGWCGDRDVFDPLAARLRERRRTVALDLPGQGGSVAPGDVTTADVVGAALDLLEELGARRVVPVAVSHAGWVAIELRRRLGPQRVPGVVLLEWMVLGPPPGFMADLRALQDERTWERVRAGLFGMWTDVLDVPEVHRYVRRMSRYGAEHWHRAGREVERSFAAEGAPVEALAALPEPCPTLHLYSRPADDALLAAQQEYSAAHPWFQAHRLPARSHFPMLEVPRQMATLIERFVAELP